jgi:hypothetical protein
MNENQIQLLITSRLEDLADQVEALVERGDHAEALLLRDEGLSLAAAADDGYTFLYLSDFHTI